MAFKWIQNTAEKSWSLFIVPDGEAEFRPTYNIALAYQHRDIWNGVVYSSFPHKPGISFVEIESLEEIKLLLETTVALRQG